MHLTTGLHIIITYNDYILFVHVLSTSTRYKFLYCLFLTYIHIISYYNKVNSRLVNREERHSLENVVCCRKDNPVGMQFQSSPSGKDFLFILVYIGKFQKINLADINIYVDPTTKGSYVALS